MRDVVKAAVAEHVVPVLRDVGYRGTFPTWRLVSDRDDTAVVHLSSSHWNTADEVEVFVEIAVVPAMWRTWLVEVYGAEVGKKPLEWEGLYQSQLHRTPEGPFGEKTWRATTEAEAHEMAQDMAEALGREGLPQLTAMLDRSVMLDSLRSGQLEELSQAFDRPGFADVAAGVLFSEVGGPELEATCGRLNAFAGAPGWVEISRKTAEWARRRAPA